MVCIFCKIVAGEIPSAKIYEDENVLAFLDINPDDKGHSLVIPKKHSENIFDTDQETLKQVVMASKNVAMKLKESLGADGIRVANNNGHVAGQLVGHFHVHVIPKYKDGTGLGLQKMSMEELGALAQKIAL